MSLPKGYKPHDGGDCPVDPEQFVDCIVRTGGGLGHSGVMRARLQQWPWSEHPDGYGQVVGYIEAAPGEQLTRGQLHKRWSEAKPRRRSKAKQAA